MSFSLTGNNRNLFVLQRLLLPHRESVQHPSTTQNETCILYNPATVVQVLKVHMTLIDPRTANINRPTCNIRKTKRIDSHFETMHINPCRLLPANPPPPPKKKKSSRAKPLFSLLSRKRVLGYLGTVPLRQGTLKTASIFRSRPERRLPVGPPPTRQQYEYRSTNRGVTGTWRQEGRRGRQLVSSRPASKPEIYRQTRPTTPTKSTRPPARPPMRRSTQNVHNFIDTYLLNVFLPNINMKKNANC